MNPSDLQKPEPMIWFRTVCRRNGLEPTDDQLAQLAEYARRLLEWNRKINLISRKDEENIWQSHLLHSISLLMRVDFPLGARILDLGTGGGLPGIPIRILRSDLSFVLLDATKKKVEAVAEETKADEPVEEVAEVAAEVAAEPTIETPAAEPKVETTDTPAE